MINIYVGNELVATMDDITVTPINESFTVEKFTTKNSYGVAFCPYCEGSVWQIQDESNYCFRCGKKLHWY